MLIHPSLDGLWAFGLPFEEGKRIRKPSDDLTWWFIEEFADPEVAQAVKRILDSVPLFFAKVASLGGGPVTLDWNFINQLRNHLKVAAWPPPYEIAVNSTKSEASRKAGQLIRRLMTAEEWRTEY